MFIGTGSAISNQASFPPARTQHAFIRKFPSLQTVQCAYRYFDVSTLTTSQKRESWYAGDGVPDSNVASHLDFLSNVHDKNLTTIAAYLHLLPR